MLDWCQLSHMLRYICQTTLHVFGEAEQQSDLITDFRLMFMFFGKFSFWSLAHVQNHNINF